MAARIVDDDGRGGVSGLMQALWEGRLGAPGRLLGAALTPPELAFRGIVAARDVAYRTGLLRSHRAPLPAISVGNLTVGGTGKTPLVRWIVDELTARGRTPGILHGGYAEDEPALHRQWFPDLPVVADRDRIRGARAAAGAGADVLVLDDAFQHRRLQRDLDIVVVAAESWTPRPRLLPRGPYREPLRALGRADCTVVTRRTAAADVAREVARSVRQRYCAATAVAYLRPDGWLAPDGSPRPGSPGDGAVAVAGIGRPDAFFRQVAGTGVELDGTMPFRDHHAYTVADAERIRARAGGAALITTAKDAVKLRRVLPDTVLWVLDQTAAFEAGRAELIKRLEEVTG